ncbi:hypothetical protein FO499_21195 [Bacillus anthracis]|uniref:hypothetical protein n=1 Tax=Bacillus cereus group TaxID=86661 RepID=UPI0005E26153|nr:MULTISPECIES: hypothetical protein [Bacillus cereus group]CJW36834.1 Uncharacterised protein [Streptococcus pneumoniae]MDA1777971.1 hypothetical protein [Bacillus cereus group sp. BY9-3LC]MDA1810464.1 hypothetical protein [Bacillus cereus]MDR4408953.1 hypothetical protein [Bacillus anthracis]SMD70612.1 hypothetical protein BACERE00184_00959 [Bacillus cereus]
MEKQHKNTVKSLITKNGCWTGFLVAKKINPAHIEGCWHLGFRVTVSSIEKLDEAIDKFVYYNCNGELGNHVSFYKK